MRYITVLLTVFALGMPVFAQAQEPTVCTMQYEPVCGTKDGVYSTYGNGCALGMEGGTYQHEGECTTAELANRQEGEYIPSAHCTAWFDGCNSCSRNASGQSMCTLMACIGEPRAGYCRTYAETRTDVPKLPKSSVTPSAPVVSSEVVTEASTPSAPPEEVQPGFFARIWTSVTNWFSRFF